MADTLGLPGCAACRVFRIHGVEVERYCTREAGCAEFAKPRIQADDPATDAVRSVIDTVAEREKTHGPFGWTAERAVALAKTSRPAVAEPPQLQHAREMICVKLARIAAGNPLEPDHWRDIAGYATLAAEHLAGRG